MKITLRKQLRRNRPEWVVDWRPPGQRRQRKFFKTKVLAEAGAESLREQQNSAGTTWLSLSAAQRSEIIWVVGEAARLGKTLREVWEGFLAGTGTVSESRALAEAIDETIAAKRAANRRERSVKMLEWYLKLFARGRESVPVKSITRSDVESWFAGRSEAMSTKASNIGRLSSMFDLCWRRGYIQENPCRKLERVSAEDKPPTVLTLKQSKQALSFVKQKCPRFSAWLVLALLAGVRPEEADRLEWTNVDLLEGVVRIDAAASKVRHRRIVKLMPSALKWMKQAKRAKADLPIPYTSRRRYLRQLRNHLGFEKWPQDVLRHTAASFLLAHHQDAGKVAHELGNSVGILLRKYRELVTRNEAEKFWRI